MKREIKLVDGTPSKRLFWSIMSDYTLNTSICELIDNALDIWLKGKQLEHLCITIDLDIDRQLIKIQDCAGGVPEQDHQLLISPSSSNNNPDENIIGLFGVGSKRAVVALAEEVRILTRHKDGSTYQIDIDASWLESDTWEMPVYEVGDIPENTTIIDLSKLRLHLSADDEANLRNHLAETYACYLKKPNFQINLNGIDVKSKEFNKWAYPPGFEPRYYMFNVSTDGGGEVGVELYAGLAGAKEPGKDDYGVYFYCNDRLIMKEVREKEVGYATGIAGVPHHDASLARVIVSMYGPAKLIPWNSSKSAVNFGHPVFKGLQNFLFRFVSDYSSLSRRFKGQWEDQVFCYTSGEIEHVDISEVTKVKRSYLPPLPKVRKNLLDQLRNKNRQIVEDKPWTLGLLESIAAVDIITRQKLETKNRIALILLDSSFEIGLKEFIAHTDQLNYGGRTLEQIFEKRDIAISVVRQMVTFDQVTLKKIRYFYSLRNKLIHEKATLSVTNADIKNYTETIQRVLNLLFSLDFN